MTPDIYVDKKQFGMHVAALVKHQLNERGVLSRTNQEVSTDISDDKEFGIAFWVSGMEHKGRMILKVKLNWSELMHTEKPQITLAAVVIEELRATFAKLRQQKIQTN
jgi:hypothetical protein